MPRSRNVTAGVSDAHALHRGTVPASYVRALLDFAVERGVGRQDLVAASGLADALLSDDDDRIPLDACVRLMGAAVSASGDPAFALKFGETVRTEALGLAFLIAGVAGTVDAARAEFNRYDGLIGDDSRGGSDALAVVKDRRGLWLEFRPSAYTAHVWLVEVAVAWCVRETRKMLALHYARRPFPRAIHFTHGEPSYRDEYERILSAPLTFASDRNALLVDDDFLTLAMPGANPYVARVLSRHAAALRAQAEKVKTMKGRVERVLVAALPSGGATLEFAARELGLSRQGLSRRLKAEGATFDRVLKDLRRELAVHDLSEGLSVSETAYRLGFSEPSAFSRAFKRWTGLTPRVYREPRTRR